MATQVKFHIVDEDKYSKITSPDPGSLYFIDDNGEIRKGSSHITGTRVFKAVDPSTGSCSPVNNLDIKIDGKSITTEGAEQPKRGDMLVVSHEIAEGKNEYSAYIYGANGGAYDVANWVACDGNVDASKVILTQDIMLAGNYTNVGNLNKGSAAGTKNFETTGKSVYDALAEMLSQDQQPGNPTNPSMTLDGQNQTKEIGTTYQAPTYTATWKDGSYTYGAWVSDGNTQTATGAKVGTWTVTAHNGKTNSDATFSGNTAKITPDPYVVSDVGVAHQLVKFVVTSDISSVLPAATNLKKKSNPEKKITSTSVTHSGDTRTITGFQNWFYGSNKVAKDYTSKDGDNATATSNWNIRQLSKGTSLTSMSIVQDATQVVIAVPSGKTLVQVLDEGALNADITANFISTTMNVGGADSTKDSIGSYAKPYKVYVMSPSASLDARTYKIKIQ